MSTNVATRMTTDEFLRLHGDESHIELVNGEVVREAMPGVRHNAICGEVFDALKQFVKPRKLGRVLPNDTFLQTGPDQFRGIDVCFISDQCLSLNQSLPVSPLPRAPEIAVEVLSPSNRPDDMQLKIDEYLAVGVDAVVVVDPDLEIASVYRKDELPQRFHNGDDFTLPDVLPGFSVPLKSFFS